MEPIYLDHDATAPLRPEALAVLADAHAHVPGNASSAHAFGAAARDLLVRARRQLAELAGVAPESLVFTSGATESNHTALHQLAARGGAHLVTCASEHISVLAGAEALRAAGVRVTVLPVGRDGRLDPDVFAESLGRDTALASVMWANNETGAVQDVAELAARARARGVAFHCDAAQALGKVPLSLSSLPVDYASFSAHKLGGPKGVGALYVRPGAPFESLLRGGSQERGRRAGTENVPGIAGFGAACAAAGRELGHSRARLAALRPRLWDGIRAAIPGVFRNGAPDHSLAHNLNVCFGGASAEALAEALDLEGVAVSTGSACHAGSTEPSHVLQAMGLSPEEARASLRFGLGPTTEPRQIERVLERLPVLVARVRRARAA
jgi:cysteine desulfurase